MNLTIFQYAKSNPRVGPKLDNANNITTLKSRLRVSQVQGHWKCYHSKALVRFAISINKPFSIPYSQRTSVSKTRNIAWARDRFYIYTT